MARPDTAATSTTRGAAVVDVDLGLDAGRGTVSDRSRDDHGRPVAPGGWRRIVIGVLVGLLAGAAVAFAMPRDDGPRRRSLLDDLDDLPDRG